MSAQILVAHEKHSTDYYAASTRDELAASALRILTRRWNEGYWYHDPADGDLDIIEILGDEWPGWDSTLEEKQAAVAAYKERIQNLYAGDEEVLNLKLGKLSRAAREYKEVAAARKWYVEARRVVEEQDLGDYIYETRGGETRNGGPIAWRLLYERSDHEYERVELEPLWTAEDA